MPGDIFNHSFFLQAVGWGILHSFWQTALLWVLYKVITAGNEKAPASFKYNLSIFCLSGSLLWFLLTTAGRYIALQNGAVLPVQFLVISHRLLPLISEQLLPVLSIIYLVVLTVYAIHFARQYFALYQFRNTQLCKAPVEIRLFTQQSAFHIGIKKKVAIWLSHKIDTPFVTGFFKPVILLPFSLLGNLTNAQAQAVILHELAHIKRNDYLLNVFQLMAEKLLFFNPFARLLSETVRQERENCCDDWVLNFRYSQHEYAHALLQVEQLRNQHLVLAMNATSGKKNLLKRIKRLFSVTPVTSVNGLQKTKLFAVAVFITAALVLLIPVTKKTLTSAPVVATKAAGETNDGSFSLAAKNNQPGEIEERTLKVNNEVVVEQTAPRLPLHKQEINRTEELPAEKPATIFINEELLEAPVLALQVSNEQPDTSKVLMVKVEEEQGGSTVKKVYYVQLNNNNGVTEVKPLAVIKQPATANYQPLNDSTKITGTHKKLQPKKLRTI